MYQKLPDLVFGFHGCNREIFERVVFHGEPMKESQNEYDWLGHGIYFWEQNYQRALEWAQKSPKIKNPAVIGAVIDRGYCLNLTDSAGAEKLKNGYIILKIWIVLLFNKFMTIIVRTIWENTTLFEEYLKKANLHILARVSGKKHIPNFVYVTQTVLKHFLILFTQIQIILCPDMTTSKRSWKISSSFLL